MHQNDWAAISLTTFDGIVSTSCWLVGRSNAQFYFDSFITHDCVMRLPQAVCRPSSATCASYLARSIDVSKWRLTHRMSQASDWEVSSTTALFYAVVTNIQKQ